MKIYCETCGHTIEASNIEDVEDGTADCYIFVHDPVVHDQDAVLETPVEE